MKNLKEKIYESVYSVLPITAIVLLLSVTFSPLDAGVLILFVFGAIMLIFGMGLFTLGAEMSMQPLGDSIGAGIGRSKKNILPLLLCFVLGVIITVAEPDLQVLARQIPSVPNGILIGAVAGGVGLFLVIAIIRTKYSLPLAKLLLVFYPAVLILALFAPKSFIAAAFDSGGVTTGPITVPFIMALGAGLASMRSDKHSGEDSFGLVALCSIGPILSVLVLSIFYNPHASTSQTVVAEIHTTKEAFSAFLHAFPEYAKEVSIALLPIVAVFVLFAVFFRKFTIYRALKICVGFVYTYVGLVLFLTGANVGFMPAGQLIGAKIASGSYKYCLIPVGMLIGYFVVKAEPAVHVLKKQVEEVSNGMISQKTILVGLSIGVAFSLGISMLRVLTGIPVFPFLVGGYAISLAISFFVPPIYTGIAFDSGGVASGPMTTTFILPFAIGACEALGGNVMTDAFGVVAMVAITPLITIQIIGLTSEIRHKIHRRKMAERTERIEDCIVYFDRVKEYEYE